MPKIVVQIMPKQELLDPAGKAVQRTLANRGQEYFTSVRIGKRFEIETDREITAELMEEVAALADEFFSNSVIEDVISIEVEEEDDEFDPASTETVTDDGFLPTGAASDGQAHANEELDESDHGHTLTHDTHTEEDIIGGGNHATHSVDGGKA